MRRTVIIGLLLLAVPFAPARGAAQGRSLAERIRLERAFKADSSVRGRTARAISAIDNLEWESRRDKQLPVETLNARAKVLPISERPRAVLQFSRNTEPGFFSGWKLNGGRTYNVTREPHADQIKEIFDRAKAVVKVRANLSASRLKRLEEGYIARLDKTFASDRKAFLTALETAAPKTLYDEALSNIRFLAQLASEAPMAAPQTGESQASWSENGVIRGPMGGERGEFSAHGTQSGVSRTLIVGARTYSIAVKAAGTGAEIKKGQRTVIEARLLLERALQVGEIIETLKTRAPELAAPLTTWLEGSEIAIDVPQPGTTYLRSVVKIDLANVGTRIAALRGAAELGGVEIVSPAFAKTVEQTLNAKAFEAVDHTPLVSKDKSASP